MNIAGSIPAYDQLEETAAFEPLRELVENIYTNEYLETLLPKWNAAIQEPDSFMALPLPEDYYARNLKNVKERARWSSSRMPCAMRWAKAVPPDAG